MSGRDAHPGPAPHGVRRPFRAGVGPKGNGDGTTGDAAALEREAARRAGYEEGLAEGRRAAEAAVAAFRETLAQRLAALASLEEALRRRHEEDLLSMVALAVEKIVRHRIEAGDAVARRALEDALSRLAGAEKVTVRAHPDEAEALREEVARLLPGSESRVIADPAIARGGCRVDSDLGSVDATLEAAMAALHEALGVEPGAQGDEDGRPHPGGDGETPPEPDDPA